MTPLHMCVYVSEILVTKGICTWTNGIPAEKTYIIKLTCVYNNTSSTPNMLSISHYFLHSKYNFLETEARTLRMKACLMFAVGIHAVHVIV